MQMGVGRGDLNGDLNGVAAKFTQAVRTSANLAANQAGIACAKRLSHTNGCLAQTAVSHKQPSHTNSRLADAKKT